MNNKGQTLVVFVILLPVICILLGYILDKCYLMYQKKELTNIADIVCEYALKEDKTENEIKQLALENDKNIKNIQMTRTDDEVQIILEKNQKSIFSKLTQQGFYFIKVTVSCIE